MTEISGSLSSEAVSGEISSTSLNGSIDSVSLTGAVSTTSLTGTISSESLTGSLGSGDILNSYEFVPYVGAERDIDLNTKNLETTGESKAAEIVATAGITLNGVRKENWDDVSEQFNELFTLTSTDIINKYVILTNTITDINSIRVFVENIGVIAEVGVDYSISDQYIYWTGYEFLTKLIAGDKLKIFYS